MALVLNGSLVIDCNDLSCLTFTDTTGGYSVSNTGGYGTPNPGIADIVKINFTINDGTDDYLYEDAPYTPSKYGTSSICLQAANFLNGATPLELVDGASYSLTYSVFIDGVVDPYEIERGFVFPCCGGAITSNLATNFSIQQNIGCAAIVFTDTTGSYNASTNPGGYGTPNPAYADITSTLISIELSNGETVNITSFLPTAADHSITINASDLGYTTLIPDQIMHITYSVFVEGDCRVGYKSTDVLLYCQTEACINSKIATILSSDCSCNDDEQVAVDNTMKMLFELDALKIVAGRNMSCIDGKIEELYQKCNAGCSNC